MASKTLQQLWRAARLFGMALIAQLYLQPHGKLSWQLAASAAVAAGESTYRQISPQGSARVLGLLARVFAFLASSASQSPSKAPEAAPAPSVQSRPESVSVALEHAAAEILTEAAAPVVEPTQAAPQRRPASDAPTGPDGRPVAITR